MENIGQGGRHACWYMRYTRQYYDYLDLCLCSGHAAISVLDAITVSGVWCSCFVELMHTPNTLAAISSEHLHLRTQAASTLHGTASFERTWGTLPTHKNAREHTQSAAAHAYRSSIRTRATANDPENV